VPDREPHPDQGAAPFVVDVLARRLAEIVGEHAVVSDPERLLVYETDALGRFFQLPLAVVLPATTEEAAAVVKAVRRAGFPIVPRGAGTGLSGGAVAAPGSVMLGTARMNRILEFDPSRRRARVQAGVLNAQLASLVRPHGLVYAPDPSSQTACTLGGNVAENSGGPHCLKYGVTRRYVQGLTLIDAEGEVVELGGASRARGSGLDLLGPVIGSEGCFGLVTEIELGLIPETEGVRTLLGLFESPAEAGEAVTSIVSDGLLPAALEIIDRHTISAVEASPYRAGYPTGVGAALVVEFDGNEFELDADADRAEAHCLAAGATEVRRATDESDRLRLWQGRKKAFGTMGRLAPDLMVQDATVPRSILPKVLRGIDEIAARYELQIANVFHAGDGNLHPNILYDRRDPELSERVERAAGEIMKLCVDAGGTITGEHGVGLDKREYVRLVAGPAELAAMAGVRDAFDPEQRWNPGKVLLDAAAPGESPPVAALPEWRPPSLATTVEVNPPDLSVRAPGDACWSEVVEAMSAAGQWTPIVAPTPEASVAEALRSGLGPLEVAWGPIRESVLGAVVDPPSGARLHLGGRVVKNVAGFDLLGLFLGEGGLGRVREATLRSYPMPERIVVLRWPTTASHSAAPGHPHPQFLHETGHALLVAGTAGWVTREVERLGSELGPPEAVEEGTEVVGPFVRGYAVDGEVSVELRPGANSDEGARFRDVVNSLANVRWSWDPTLRRGRVAQPAGDADVERWAGIARALGREGGGCAALSGPGSVTSAIERATREGEPGLAAAARLESRVRVALGDDRGGHVTGRSGGGA